ncbi:hypothetical protein [Streptomyces sp. NBC_01637]|uniref:hypothetical protein n=1 Tax=unclassified Streptomyces TaxID=2593676 RepID=UPI003866B28E|nr:hypothetical protein OH719_26045 [Streptomyces sp. NBC_01653]WTD89857.1 hypothetical protein OG891_20825 [Streptomyces sp. NBC_01637]
MQNPTQPDGVRALLDVVLEAIDLPYPATVGDEETYRKILDQRLGLALVVARAALAEAPDSIGWNADYLRRKLSEHPATGYRSLADEEASR